MKPARLANCLCFLVRLFVALTVAAFSLEPRDSRAATGSATFAGKTIRLLIGQPAGGGYDNYGRLLAQYLPGALPGHPTVTVENMPGAGSIVMANYIFREAPNDGTVIGIGGGTIATADLFKVTGARFDPRKFTWLGSMNSETGVAVSWHASAVQRSEDLFTKQLLSAGAGANSDSVTFPNAMNAILGTRFKIIPGYQGSSDMVLAMERGEVEGIGNWHYSAIMTMRPKWLPEKTITPLLQIALTRHPELPDVPTALDLAKTDRQKTLIKLVLAQQAVGRPVIAPPATRQEQATALKAAFASLITNPDFLSEAKRIGVEVTHPLDSAGAEAVVDDVYKADPDLIKQAAAAISPSGLATPK